MFFRYKRVRRDPYSLSIYESERPIRLDEARLEAWALSVGQRRQSYQPERKPHRGMLPDVDLSLAVPAERRPGLIARLFRRLFPRKRDGQAPAEEPGRTEGPHAALGESARKPYVWLVDADVSVSDETEPSAPAVEYNGSRAA